jgi:hypothetical protein
MTVIFRIFLVLIITLCIFGCSGETNDATVPPAETGYIGHNAAAHQLWGLWQFRIDPTAEQVECAQLRSGELHLNALSLLEPPANVNLTIEGVPQFSAGNVTIDIGLHHPADGQVALTGFDVKGILIGNGTIPIDDLPQLIFAGDSDIRLLNPDGYTRWWNPAEFPYNAAMPHQGYVDGLLGIPDSTAHFTGTLNPYKYYCDDLTAESDVDEIQVAHRGYFSAGKKNVRQYVIDFTPSGFVFNYAVDASWLPPTVQPPATQVPDDFPPGANQPEPYRVIVHEISNSLTYNTTTSQASGSLSLEVDIYDWVGAGQDVLCGYATYGEVYGSCNSWPISGGEGYSTYQFDTAPQNMNSADDILLWVAAECQSPSGYNGKLPFEIQGTYFPYIVKVKEEN